VCRQWFTARSKERKEEEKRERSGCPRERKQKIPAHGWRPGKNRAIGSRFQRKKRRRREKIPDSTAACASIIHYAVEKRKLVGGKKERALGEQASPRAVTKKIRERSRL